MKLLVNDDWANFTTSFYLESFRGDRRVIIGYKDGNLIEQTIDGTTVSAEPIIPLLVVPNAFAKQFISAVVDYASEKGVKTVNENLMQGKLAATELHLADMRRHFALAFDKIVEK